ncbi:MAG TPA: hypothetical protein VMB71_13820 [Acetobacteraceae bacterium]|nr:hypothetical protein [Acetobacteraceae bacterium]
MPRYYRTVLATALMATLSLPAFAQTLTPTTEPATPPATSTDKPADAMATAKPVPHTKHHAVRHRLTAHHVATKPTPPAQG